MWWSDQTIPPVNTAPCGGQIKPYHRSTQHHVVVRSNHTTGQHSTTWWSDRHAFHHSTQHHMAVRSNHSTIQHSTTGQSDQTIPPANTAPHGSQIKPFHQSTQHHRAVRSNHSTSQHSTTWLSGGRLQRKEAGLKPLARKPSVPPVNPFIAPPSENSGLKGVSIRLQTVGFLAQ